MSTNNNNANKKAKKDSTWPEEFEQLRQYLLQGPFDVNHPAMTAALKGLEKEVKSRNRDVKLQEKFTASSSSSANKNGSMATTTTEQLPVVDDAVRVEKPASPELMESTSMTDDWHDVTTEEGEGSQHYKMDDGGGGDDNSYLGSVLAKSAVSAIASHQVRCKSPTGAIAAALHASLLQVGFVCTGLLPDNSKAAAGGFAAPVRALSPNLFLPTNWEKKEPEEIKLRYRKDGTGAIVLTVAPSMDNSEQHVRILLAPSSTPQEGTNAMEVVLGDHVNLDSWYRATKNAETISPTLHYKALPLLLTKFSRQFDLGPVSDDAAGEKSSTALPSETNQASQYVDYTMLQTRGQNPPAGVPCPSNNGDPFPSRPVFGIPAGMQPPLPGQPHSDFSGDLTPAGIQPFPGGFPANPGNLMGPNHPMFAGRGGMMNPMDPNHPDPGGMKPRFDPFGPPGGPTEPDDPDNLMLPKKGGPRIPPGGTGDPNNDLAKPPSLGNNNMFL